MYIAFIDSGAQTKIMEVADLYLQIAEKHHFDVVLKEEQVKILSLIIEGKDVFGLLPTGYGKSMTYILAPLLLERIKKKRQTALVISPLRALMSDQVRELREHNIPAAAIMRNMSAECLGALQSKEANVIFASPEAVLDKKWTKYIKTMMKSGQICLLAFDECHCISEWGMEFRTEYRKCSELTSLCDSPVLMLTATATPAIHKDVCENLGIKDASLVSKLPNRPNIFIHYVTVKEQHEEHLKWIIDHVGHQKVHSKKIIVYCINIRCCFKLFNWAMDELGESAYTGCKTVGNRLVDMYHSHVDKETSERILADFTKSGSQIRLLFSTVAFGMGIQIHDLDIIVHWGAATSILQYWQQVGRCARDGRKGLGVVYAYPRSLHQCTDKVLKELSPSSDCIRARVLNEFLVEQSGCDSLSSILPKNKCSKVCTICICDFCSCCTYCKSLCVCKGNTDIKSSPLNYFF